MELRFPDQWFQSESGLHQNWMRDYDPTTGRYIQADPLGLVDGASVYGYVGGNPLIRIDPTGLKEKGGTTREGVVYNLTNRNVMIFNTDIGESRTLAAQENNLVGISMA